MVKCTIEKSKLHGTYTPPPSKLIAHRMLWASSIGQGGVIGNLPTSINLQPFLDMASSFGADIKYVNNTADIFGPNVPLPTTELSCFNNVLATRFALPLASLIGKSVKLTDVSIAGHNSPWLDELAENTFFRITKTANTITLKGPPEVDSLVFEGLPGIYWAPGYIMALALDSKTNYLILDDFCATHPQITTTLSVLETFGITYYLGEKDHILTLPQSQVYPARYVDVPASWSIGSYYIGALTLCGNGIINLSAYGGQPEYEFWLHLKANKILTESKDGLKMTIRSSLPINFPNTIDPRHYPSILPLIMLLCTKAAMPTKIGPLIPVSPKTLWRARKMTQQLQILGADVKIKDSYIYINPSRLEGATVDCGDDSKIAMALTLAGFICKGKLVLEKSEAALRASPTFYDDLIMMGAKITFGKKSIIYQQFEN